jgi:hypothetical protein
VARAPTRPGGPRRESLRIGPPCGDARKQRPRLCGVRRTRGRDDTRKLSHPQDTRAGARLRRLGLAAVRKTLGRDASCFMGVRASGGWGPQQSSGIDGRSGSFVRSPVSVRRKFGHTSASFCTGLARPRASCVEDGSRSKTATTGATRWSGSWHSAGAERACPASEHPPPLFEPVDAV